MSRASVLQASFRGTNLQGAQIDDVNFERSIFTDVLMRGCGANATARDVAHWFTRRRACRAPKAAHKMDYRDIISPRPGPGEYGNSDAGVAHAEGAPCKTFDGAQKLHDGEAGDAAAKTRPCSSLGAAR